MSRLRFAVAVAVVSAVTFLGSLLGATYLRTPTAVAASAKRAPSPTALAARIAAVNRRLDRLEQRLHRDGQKVENQLRNIEAAIDLLGGNACGLGSVWNYLAQLRAALIAGDSLPPADQQLCL